MLLNCFIFAFAMLFFFFTYGVFHFDTLLYHCCKNGVDLNLHFCVLSFTDTVLVCPLYTKCITDC